jgi:2-keto-3-deoxy-galactonokinase
MANEFEIVIKLDDGSIVSGLANIQNKAQDTARGAESSLIGAFRKLMEA